MWPYYQIWPKTLHAKVVIIWKFQVLCSLLTSNYTFTWLKNEVLPQDLIFSNVLFSTWPVQLSLFSKTSNFHFLMQVWNLNKVQMLIIPTTSNYHFYKLKYEVSNFKCNVLYWPPIITFTCKSLKCDIFKCHYSILGSNYHFYMLKYEIW